LKDNRTIVRRDNNPTRTYLLAGGTGETGDGKGFVLTVEVDGQLVALGRDYAADNVVGSGRRTRHVFELRVGENGRLGW
jgi:hypothetical protein